MNNFFEQYSASLGLEKLKNESTLFVSKILEQLKNKKEEGKPLYLQVKVLPESTTNEIVDQLEDGTYKIRITAPATDGKANGELVKFLKKSLKASEVVIVSGQKDRVKLVKIE